MGDFFTLVFSNADANADYILGLIRQNQQLWNTFGDNSSKFSDWLKHNALRANDEFGNNPGAARDTINALLRFFNYAYPRASNTIKDRFNIFADYAVKIIVLRKDDFIDGLRDQLLDYLKEHNGDQKDYEYHISCYQLGFYSNEQFIELSTKVSEEDLLKLFYTRDENLKTLFSEIIKRRGWKDKDTFDVLRKEGLLPEEVYLSSLDDNKLAQILLEGDPSNRQLIKDILSRRTEWNGQWKYAKALYEMRILSVFPVKSLSSFCDFQDDLAVKEVLSINDFHLLKSACIALINKSENKFEQLETAKKIWREIIKREDIDSFDPISNDYSRIRESFERGDYITIIHLYFTDSPAVLSLVKEALSKNRELTEKLKEDIKLIKWDHYVSEREFKCLFPSLDELRHNTEFIKTKLCIIIKQSDIYNLREDRNKEFIDYTKKNAADILGNYNSEFSILSEEQKNAVLTDEDNTLVEASAGSGKTFLLKSKFKYLTKVCGIDSTRIKILAFNKKVANELCNDLSKELGIPKEEKQSTTFHSFAFGFSKTTLRDSKKDPISGREDHDSRVHDILDRIDDSKVYDKMYEYIINYGSNDRFIQGKQYYLSYYKDTKGKHGSLNSYEERRIFDFLAENGVKFAYEEFDPATKSHVDFTIYLEDNTKLYYEHAAIREDNTSPFSDYLVTFRKKEKKHLEAGHHFIYTHTGNDYIKELRDKLQGFVHLEKDENLIETNKKQFLKNNEYYSTVKQYLMVKDCLRENLCHTDILQKCLSSIPTDETMFLTNVFFPLDRIYNSILEKETDFVGLIELFIKKCSSKQITPGYDYILVDEYQDMTTLRHKMLMVLRKISPKLKIYAVGDYRQSIYSFTETKKNLFTDFEQSWGDRGGAKRLQMSQTRRFSEPLAQVSNKFISDGQNPVKPFPKETSTKVSIIAKDTFKDECTFIAKTIKERGLSYDKKDYLVLVRTNDDMRLLDQHGITCDTIHSAKGAEAKYVFILNCNRRNMPYEYKRQGNVIQRILNRIRGFSDNDQNKEEKRIFYVALTRAQEEVFLLHKINEESPYVTEIKKILSQ